MLNDLNAASRLLIDWGRLPFTLTVTGGTPSDRAAWPWTGSLEPQRFADLTGVPVTDVRVLVHPADDDTGDDGPSRPLDETAADVRTLLLALTGPDPEPRVLELATALAYSLADHDDLAQATTEPPSALCLIGRGYTHASAYTFTPCPPEALEPLERLRLEAALLCDFVWLNNNDQMRLDPYLAPHDLGEADDPAFRAWWPASEAAAWLADAYDQCEDLPLERLDAEEFAAVRAGLLDDCVAAARSSWWLMEHFEDEACDEESHYPGRGLVEALCESVIGGLIAEVGDGPVYRIGWSEEQEYGPVGALVFVGRERLGVLAMDASV